MDLNFNFIKNIELNVKPFVTVTFVDVLNVNERRGSIVCQLIDDQGNEVERKEIILTAGEVFEKFYNDYVATSVVAERIVEETSIPVPTDIVDPVIEEGV